jgi:streptomycin 6-kinase
MPKHLVARIQQHVRDWHLTIENSFETETSVISFVTRANQNLVLKVIKQLGDEWHAGEVIRAFDGKGVVTVYEHTDGAMLLECLQPGASLSNLVLTGREEEATEILAGIIEKMSPREAPAKCPTVEDWGTGFKRHLDSGAIQIPKDLIKSAQRTFLDLCSSQGRPRLLHGDLHHYNVLFDLNRGWVAIDPKGVTGELEYEIGAILRNPSEHPDLFLKPAIIERRIDQLSSRLKLDRTRVTAWAFAQAVLSAIWELEDGFELNPSNPALRLARVIQPMV